FSDARKTRGIQSYPYGIRQQTMNRHASDPALRKRILQLNASHRAHWGRMNVHQMICHLNDSFLLALGERTASPATGFFQRTLMKWGALYFPAPWPKGVPTRLEMEQGVGGTKTQEFESDRAALLLTIERFCEPARSFASIEHPIFGPMSSN